MPKTYILTHRQLQSSCTLNSIGFATLMMANPGLLASLEKSGERPNLFEYTQLLGKLNLLFMNRFAWEFGLNEPVYMKAFDTFSESLGRMSGPTKEEINAFYKVLNEYAELKDRLFDIPGIAQIRDKNPPNDPLGLLRLSKAVAIETRKNPAYQVVGSLIDQSDQYYQDHLMGSGKNVGLTIDDLNNQFSKPDLRNQVASDAQTIRLQNTGNAVYFASDQDAVNKFIDQEIANRLPFSKPLQIIAGGHAIIYGYNEGKYWKFDAIGKPNDDNDTERFATVTVYEESEKDKMLDEMKNILPHLNAQKAKNRTMVFRTIDVTLISPELRSQSLQRATLGAKLDDLGEKYKDFQEQGVEDISTKISYLVQLIQALEPETSKFPDLDQKQKALLDTVQKKDDDSFKSKLFFK